MRYLLLLLLSACATAPPAVFPGAKPPRTLSAAEVDMLTKGKPIAISVEATYASFSSHSGAAAYCPSVGTPAPVLYLDLPFPVGIALFPAQRGSTHWEHHASSATLETTVAVCPVTEAGALQKVEGPHELRVVVQSPPDVQRTVLIAPEGVAEPIVRPDDFDPGTDVALRDLRLHLAFAPREPNTFDPWVDALFAAAPKQTIVFTAEDEPALILFHTTSNALVLFIDGTTASLPLSTLSSSSLTPRFRPQSALRFNPPVAPASIVSQTHAPDASHPPSALPPEDNSREYLEAFLALPLKAAPELSREVNAWLPRQAPISAKLKACWARTRCTVSVRYLSGCENPAPGHPCDPGPPQPVYGSSCQAKEPYRTLLEAASARQSQCGALEVELSQLTVDAYRTLVEYVERWKRDQLERNRAAVLKALGAARD